MIATIWRLSSFSKGICQVHQEDYKLFNHGFVEMSKREQHGMCALFITFQKRSGVYYVPLQQRTIPEKNGSLSLSLKTTVICNLVNGKKTATDQARSIMTNLYMAWGHTRNNKWNGEEMPSVIIWLNCHLFSFQTQCLWLPGPNYFCMSFPYENLLCLCSVVTSLEENY